MKWPAWTADLFAVIGAVTYSIQIWIYAHTTIPSLDEGAYLYKGYLFVSGVYRPFQPYGPLTNKAPLAFLIPGAVEYVFGPGLQTGRFFAIFLGLFTLLGTWLTARRLAGKWLAAATIWAFALSPMIIKIHGTASSEGLIACMLAWMLFLALGENQPLWRLILSAVLSALIILTRQNIILAFPILVGYIFWQHGRKAGIWSFVAGLLVLLIGHAIYWPNILMIWAPWLPKSLTPFLSPFRLPPGSLALWQPDISVANRFMAFFQGFRFHLIVLLGAFATVLLWPRRKDEWEDASRWRAGIFLIVLYFALVALHAWAAVASQYSDYSCVFCFNPYLTFFDPVGLILIVISISSWRQNPTRLTQMIGMFFILAFSASVGYSAFEDFNPALLNIPFPRMRGGQFLAGFTTLQEFLSNKFALPLVTMKKYASTILGLLVGLAILSVVYVVWTQLRRRGTVRNYFALALNVSLAAAFVMTPLLGGSASQPDCNQDLIASNAAVGKYLAGVIPSGSLVYWDGGLSWIPLSYVTGIRIFPPQINDGYTALSGGNADTVYRLSHWTYELDDQWKQAANIFIIEDKRYASWKNFLAPDRFQEYPRSSATKSCEDGSGLRVFSRIP